MMGAAATLSEDLTSQAGSREALATGASVTVEAAILARAMRQAAKVVEARNTIPILSNVRLTVDPFIGKMELLTTDMDVEYRQRVPIVDGTPFAITVDAGRLAALASAVDNAAQMRLTLKDGRLTVSAGRGRWVLPTLPSDDFPSIEFAAMTGVTVEPASALSRALDRVMWSRSTEATRYYLNGPLLNPEDGKLRLVTTNGHSVAAVMLDVAWPEDASEIILGPKWCTSLIAVLADMAGPVGLTWDGAKIRADIGDIVLTGKAIDGSFPEYRRVIPQVVAHPIIVDPETLKSAVRRVKLLGNEKTRMVKFATETGKITISHVSPDHGTATEDVPADCQGTHETGFNAEYLTSMMDAMGGDSIEIHHADAGAPALFRRVVSDGAMGVIMPVRV